MRGLLIPLVACIACAVVVSITAVSVRAEQNLNVENEKKTKILAAAGIVTDNVDLEFSKIETLYVDFTTGQFVDVDAKYDHIKAANTPSTSKLVPKDKDIAILKRQENIGPVYLWRDNNDDIEKVVLPIRGYGLWGTLYGYLSLSSDLNTVQGIEYYEHKETPGLGGEVDNPNWKGGWKGKKIFTETGAVNLKVVKGTSSSDYEIDGIFGATLTTNGVTNMIQYWLGDEAYGPVLKNLKEST